MTERDTLAERFEENRGHLRAVAYRLLGSLTEADDAVQEAWLRLSGADAGEIRNLSAWLTTVVGRVSLDRLRSRESRREEPMGVRLPDPIVSSIDGVDPEDEALLGESVGLALHVVLEALSPAERVAFVLHDMFAVPFDDIAPIVDRTPVTARKLASRASRRAEEAPAPDPDVFEVRPAPAAGPGERRRGRPDGPGGEGLLADRVHHHGREGRRDGHPGGSRATGTVLTGPARPR